MGADPRPDLVQDDSPFGALQFTVDEVKSVLLELVVSKSAGSDSIPTFIPLSLLFNRSLSTCVFPTGGKAGTTT
jgi:hypothetical protein